MADRELDTQVAERQAAIVRLAREVMGWRVHARNTIHWTDAATWNQCGDYPIRAEVGRWDPFASIADAMMLLPPLRSFGMWSFKLETWGMSEWEVELVTWRCYANRKAATAPEAICLAVLEALNAEAAND